MDVAGYLAIARRWWLLIALATVLGGVGGWLGSSTAPRTYESQARLLVGPVNADFDTLRAAEQLTQTYANVATSDAVLSGAGSESGISAAELRDVVSARADGPARLVTIRAKSVDPARAAELANAVSASLATFASAAAARPEGEIRVVDPGTPPTSAIAPQVELIALLSALGALLAALAVVAVLELADDRIRSLDDLRTLTDRPTAGVVTTGASSLVAADPRRPEAGAYRAAAGMLPISPDLTTAVVIGDADGGSQSDEVTANLAAAIMSSGIGVRVIDAREGEAMDPALLAELRTLAPSVRAGGKRARTTTDLDIRRGTTADALEMAARLDASELEESSAAPSLTLVDIGDPRSALGARAWTLTADAIVITATIGVTHRKALREVLDRVAATSHVRPVVLAARQRNLREQIREATPAVTARPFRSARSSGTQPGKR